MATLFPVEPAFPEGFGYYPDFLTPAEEKVLVELIAGFDLKNMNYHGYTANRKVLSFGYDYNYENNRITKGETIPGSFDFLVEKVAARTGITKTEFVELLITEYPPGAVINWHRDVPQFEIIVGISLLADCIFRLRPYEKERRTRKSIISLRVQRRSMYIMKGTTRTEWQHSISAVKEKRYSITLRTLRLQQKPR